MRVDYSGIGFTANFVTIADATEGCGPNYRTKAGYALSGTPNKVLVTYIPNVAIRAEFIEMYDPLPYDASHLLYLSGSQVRWRMQLPTGGFANAYGDGPSVYGTMWYNECGDSLYRDFRVKG